MNRAALKIALVWNHPSRLLDCSFRFEQYVDGFRRLGHDPVVVCKQDLADGFDGPVETTASTDRFAEPDFWRRVGADVAVIVTWHRMANVLTAMRAAGTRVIAIADTDGRLSLRAYPAAALERLMVYQGSLLDRSRCLKYWLGKRLARGSEEDSQALASTRASDTVLFGHERGKDHFDRFLAIYGEQTLSQRLGVVPFAVGASFLHCPIPETKKNRIVAIGRWDDPQKHAGLLASVLHRFLDSNQAKARPEITIFGQGSEPWFADLAGRYAGIHVAGIQPQETVARALASARSIVFSSRWEGSPHAALEALASGATLVGPPIPSLASWSGGGRYGTVSRAHRSASLTRALVREMTAWDEGRRDSTRISEHWRARLAPEAVCRQMLEAFPRS